MNETILETERLILRHIDPDKDFNHLASMYSDPETMTYIGGNVFNRAQSWRSLATMIGHLQMRGYCFMSVIEKATGEWVGRVGPWNPEGWPAPEIGWTIHRNHWRKGYAKEAGAACIDYVRDELGWTSVIHVIQDGNIGSMKTAEALGSHRLRSINGIPAVTEALCWIYGQEF